MSPYSKALVVLSILPPSRISLEFFTPTIVFNISIVELKRDKPILIIQHIEIYDSYVLLFKI